VTLPDANCCLYYQACDRVQNTRSKQTQDLILTLCKLFKFLKNSSKFYSSTAKEKADGKTVVFMRAVPVCIWTSWEVLAEGQRWTIFGYGREIIGPYRSRHENTNKSICAIWRKCWRMSRTSVCFTQTHIQYNVLQCDTIPEVLFTGVVKTNSSHNSELQACDKCFKICR